MWGLVISAVLVLLTTVSGGMLGWVLCVIRYRDRDAWNDGYEHGFQDGIREKAT